MGNRYDPMQRRFDRRMERRSQKDALLRQMGYGYRYVEKPVVKWAGLRESKAEKKAERKQRTKEYVRENRRRAEAEVRYRDEALF